ncbi:class II aldolase/adducin family protein [Paenibacillus sp. OV219]|uniref:class II aldolase/adducin family protein n=1 Tax=Paenibacillus sp. OV219 TaxID=1884377 RepID=UPI0008B0D90D|nr:class II aldolase/adducin family protein [Paenibacillus sp. OV219]SEO00389.1 L-fuculose-phosphate aldolase [Paenibacillus sp. OV219]
MHMDTLEAKERVVKAGRKLVESKLIARTWGNVSCRISDSHFVITPRGRDYLQMTVNDIVEVAIADCSYSGDVKPSSEKAMHAAVYKQYPEVNFVIHTHQENASVVSAAGLEAMKVVGEYPLLGGEVICAEYALPTTTKLARKVSKVLMRKGGQAVILAKHGALCFGVSDDEAFQVATDLETACADYVNSQYNHLSGNNSGDLVELSYYAISRLMGKPQPLPEAMESGFYFESERTDSGFRLKLNNGATIEVKSGELHSSMPEEAKLLNEIYQSFNDINYIVHTNSLSVAAVSHADLTVRPLLDDFAQLVGTSVKTVTPWNAPRIRSALKHASAVLLHREGALCCGSTRSDATAVAMVLEKNCKALIGASLFGPVKPIHQLESMLMRFMYLKSYSKQAAKKS